MTGEYAEIVALFGSPAFLPTSRLKRAPSRPTGFNRSPLFTKKQKENIRREMCELLDTEENYVNKLDHLIHVVASDYRQKAKSKPASSSSPSHADLANLFPNSLDQILHVNSAFLYGLRTIIEETENDAIADIEASGDHTMFHSSGTTEPTGTVALAACLRSFFPKFLTCYVDYTRSHTHFPQIIRNFTKDAHSSFSKRVQDTGEQRLMSMLIEPIQRLPRYNLYIDNILKQLPAKHPAIQPLLKARDTISEICSQDSVAVAPSKIVNYLRRAIQSWPLTIKPAGRLITAMDAIELSPPYRSDHLRQATGHCIVLIFSDYFVILGKLGHSAITARNLLTMIDAQEPSHVDHKMDDLAFKQAYELNKFDFVECDSGKMIQISPTFDVAMNMPPMRPGSAAYNHSQVFYLTGIHEGKASRVLEDITKARVEGRYSETERESHKWEVRTAAGNDLTLFIALSEESIPPPAGRGTPSRISLCVEPSSCKSHVTTDGFEVYASLSRTKDNTYLLEVSGPNDFNSQDNLTAVEFVPVLSKRLSNLLQLKHQIKTSANTKTLLLRNQHILQSLRIITTDLTDGSKERSRPPSPVKLLANIFGGSIRESNRKHHQSTLSLGDIPNLTPMVRRQSDNASIQSGQINVSHSASDAIDKLQDTLSSYILALHARKGNIVGKVLRARAIADELLVNELYNSLLEDPDNYQFAAQVPVDVLFAAFEKFMRVAWQDKMGSLFSKDVWQVIQAKLDSYQPGEFEDTFKAKFNDMSPQNQRALKSIVKLLADLLEGTGNDGDRGILTASFAEVLVPDGNIHSFVSFLDRLVDELAPLLSQSSYNEHGLNPESPHKASNSGSMTSQTSSLRKKLGLLKRMGSKNQNNLETEAESVSVWRTLSKSKHGNDNSQPSSLSKANSLSRMNSTDAMNLAGLSPNRPTSRDRPTVLGAFSFENSRPLSTIGESQSPERPRKKRRSSLSDLTALHSSVNNTPSFITPRTPSKLISSPISDSPRTPSPTKLSFIPQPNSTASGRPSSSSRSENSPARMLKMASPPKLKPATSPTDEVTITTSPSRRRNTNNSSAIPTLRQNPNVLSERPTSGNARKLPAPPGSAEKSIVNQYNVAPLMEKVAPLNPAAGRLRMQSPQKIRERLTAEQGAVANAETALQTDMSKLAEDIAHSSRPRSSGSSRVSTTPTVATKVLEQKLATLATKHATLLSSIKIRLDALSSDLSSSLQVSEARVKSLDELYREANAENEALYARFNEELSKILSAVKGGEGQRETVRRVKEVEEENAKLRRENGRLKREIVGLRAQLKD